MGADVGGSPESVRAVNRRLEGKRRHRPDPWDAHEARAQLVVLHRPQQHGMKRSQLLHQGLASREEGFHAQRQMWAFGDQFAHAWREGASTDATNLEPEWTQCATDPVLMVADLVDE